MFVYTIQFFKLKFHFLNSNEKKKKNKNVNIFKVHKTRN